VRPEDQPFGEQSRTPVSRNAMSGLLKDIPGFVWSEIETYKEKASTKSSGDLWIVIVLERSGGR
jgi:hypothetical protein